MSRFCKRAGLILMFVAPVAQSQQEEQPNQEDEDLLSGDIIFDDDLFGNVFDEQTNSDTNSWLEGFTVQIRQQFYGQVNNHSVEPIPGFSFPREADMENNRLGVNIRYQNSFAPGGLFKLAAKLELTGKMTMNTKRTIMKSTPNTVSMNFSYNVASINIA